MTYSEGHLIFWRTELIIFSSVRYSRSLARDQRLNGLPSKSTSADKYGVALTARHKQAITSAIADLEKAIDELKAGNDEVAAMMLRTAYHSLEGIEQSRRAGVDEQVLDRIFSRFCIGK
jgi:tRNA U34 5-carboxymethylaminomethyl modifying GTPase MnmE/TrmE